MIAIALLTLKILLLLLFVGFGFTYTFIPRILRDDAFWLAPWFGTVLISVFGVVFSLAKVPMIQASYMILAVSVVFFLYALFAGKIAVSLGKSFFVMIALTLTTLFINLIPLIVRAGFPTTASLGNLDPLSYSPVGDFLVKSTVIQGADFEHYKPYLWATGDLLHSSFRWGSPILLSFFDTVLHLRSYQIYSILLTIFFALTFPLVYILAKKLTSKKSEYLLLIVFLTFALNSTLFYMLYNVFFAQFVFSGIYVLIGILVYSYFFETRETLNFNSHDLLIALCIASITTVYAEGLLFVLLPLGFLLLFSLFTKQRAFVTIALSKILLLSFIISPTSAGTAIRQNLHIILSSTKSAFIGWEKIPFAAPLEIMGFYNLYYSRDIPTILDIAVGIPIAIIWLIGLIKSKSYRFLLTYLATFIPFYIALRFVFPNFFSYHRAITYSLFLYPILFGIGVCYLLSLTKNKIIIYGVLLVIAGLSLRSSYRSFYQFYWHPRVVDTSLTSLEALNQSKKITKPFFTSDVYLGESDLWNRLWPEYFLMNKLIVTRQNYSTERKYLSDIKLVLSPKQKLEYKGKKIVYKNIVWQNQYYQLGEIYPLDVAIDLQDKKNK